MNVLDPAALMEDVERYETENQTEEVNVVRANVLNLTWAELASKLENDSHYGGEFPYMEILSELNTKNSQVINPLQVIICQDVNGYMQVVVSSAEHLIPYMDGYSNVAIFSTSRGSFIPSGLRFIYTSNEGDVLDTFVPYGKGKKVYAYGTQDPETTGYRHYYCVGTCKETERIPTPISEIPTVRPLTSPINEMDLMHCSHQSAKFKNASSGWETLADAIKYLNNSILNTIDPSYMLKILELNKTLSYPTYEYETGESSEESESSE